MNAALIPLMPKTLRFRNRNFRLLKDRHLFDTENVLTTDVSKDFFKTLGTKRKSQAIFVGDLSLVKEANVFLAVQLQAVIRTLQVIAADWLSFFRNGYFRWDVIVPETVTVDEDQLAHISPGPDMEQFPGGTATDIAASGDETYMGRRTYLAGENKVVPGGRAVEFSVNWSETGGNGLTAAQDLTVIFGGGEYEPSRA
jgi:hypothetical protein